MAKGNGTTRSGSAANPNGIGGGEGVYKSPYTNPIAMQMKDTMGKGLNLLTAEEKAAYLSDKGLTNAPLEKILDHELELYGDFTGSPKSFADDIREYIKDNELIKGYGMTTSGAKANNIIIKKSNTKEKANVVTKKSAKGNKTKLETQASYSKKLNDYLKKTSKEGGFDMKKAFELKNKANWEMSVFFKALDAYGLNKLKK